jgi:hypothetical protein
MTDYTNTYPDLVNVEDWLNAKGYTGEAGACHAAMSLIRKQEARIADLRKEADMMHSEYKTARARIAELKAALKPFADKADKAEGPFEPPYPVDYSLWRAARAAYLGEK